MAALTIIKDLYVFKQRLSCLLMPLIVGVINEFALQRAEKALDHGVVITLAYPAHTGLEVVLCQ
jgi:hypothetical protein